MKRVWLSTFVFGWVFFSTFSLAATYDATGKWNYSVSGHSNQCGEPPEPNETGTAVLIQTANSFLMVVTSSTAGNLRTVSGTISGAVYSLSDRYWEDSGWVNESVTFTLTSPSSGSGSGSWTWSGGGESCSGGYQLSMTLQPQSPPAYDASGKWDYAETDSWNNCGESNPADETGTMTIQQSGNRITATDDKGGTSQGFVSGATLTLVDSYAEDGGISSVVCTINLSSASRGTGSCWWVWDLNGNSNEHCEGGSNISTTKQAVQKSKAMPWLPLLGLDD
jgi:hypothetical protein